MSIFELLDQLTAIAARPDMPATASQELGQLTYKLRFALQDAHTKAYDYAQIDSLLYKGNSVRRTAQLTLCSPARVSRRRRDLIAKGLMGAKHTKQKQ